VVSLRKTKKEQKEEGGERGRQIFKNRRLLGGGCLAGLLEGLECAEGVKIYRGKGWKKFKNSSDC
jgi:hypothetical protein